MRTKKSVLGQWEINQICLPISKKIFSSLFLVLYLYFPLWSPFQSTTVCIKLVPSVLFACIKVCFSPIIYLDEYSFVPVDKILPALQKVKKPCFTNWNPKISKLGMSSAPTLSTGPSGHWTAACVSWWDGIWGNWMRVVRMRSAEQLPLSSKMAANRLTSTVDRSDPDNKEGGGILGNMSTQLQYFQNLYGVRRFATIPRTPSDKSEQIGFVKRNNILCVVIFFETPSSFFLIIHIFSSVL